MQGFRRKVSAFSAIFLSRGCIGDWRRGRLGSRLIYFAICHFSSLYIIHKAMHALYHTVHDKLISNSYVSAWEMVTCS